MAVRAPGPTPHPLPRELPSRGAFRGSVGASVACLLNLTLPPNSPGEHCSPLHPLNRRFCRGVLTPPRPFIIIAIFCVNRRGGFHIRPQCTRTCRGVGALALPQDSLGEHGSPLCFFCIAIPKSLAMITTFHTPLNRCGSVAFSPMIRYNIFCINM